LAGGSADNDGFAHDESFERLPAFGQFSSVSLDAGEKHQFRNAGTSIAHGDEMSRDHTKLRFFSTADELTVAIYRVTESLPAAERYGLQSQMRRASVSVVTNIVEGACRRTDRAYSQFLEIALGSASWELMATNRGAPPSA
jgi:hypothetical protein